MADLWIYTLLYLSFTLMAPCTPYICVLWSENIDNPVQNRWDTLNLYEISLFSPLPPNSNFGKCSGSETEYRDTSFSSISQHCTWGEGGNAFDADYSNGFSNFGPISYLSHLFMHRIVVTLRSLALFCTPFFNANNLSCLLQIFLRKNTKCFKVYFLRLLGTSW